MKKIYSLFACALLFFAGSIFAQESESTPSSELNAPQEQRETLPTNAAETYKDVEKTLGFVPEFIKSYPEVGVTGAWIKMKQLEMGETSIDQLNKELLSLAVAAQVPCDYCVIFHTAAAKANGATDQQIKEAVALAGGVREWSSVLNGLNVDKAQFKSDVDKIMKNMEKGKKMAE